MHCSGDGVADDLDDGVADDADGGVADDDDNQDLEIFMPVARAGICQVVGTSSRSVSVSDIVITIVIIIVIIIVPPLSCLSSTHHHLHLESNSVVK